MFQIFVGSLDISRTSRKGNIVIDETTAGVSVEVRSLKAIYPFDGNLFRFTTNLATVPGSFSVAS